MLLLIRQVEAAKEEDSDFELGSPQKLSQVKALCSFDGVEYEIEGIQGEAFYQKYSLFSYSITNVCCHKCLSKTKWKVYIDIV